MKTVLINVLTTLSESLEPVTFNSPVSEAKVDCFIRQLCSHLKLGTNSSVLDIGCGQGALLRRVCEQSGARGHGLDISAKEIAIANEHAAQSSSQLTFECCDLSAASLNNDFDLVICMGATHAFAMGAEAFPKALEDAKSFLRQGGLFWIGEGYWRQDPDPEYLDFLGPTPGVYRDYEQNLELAENAGFEPLFCMRSSRDEWDEFEWNFKLRAEQAATLNPESAELCQRRDQLRHWNRMYRRFGRETMGFGLYLLQQK